MLASVASFHSHQTTMVNSLRIKSIVWVGSFVLLDQGRIVATGTSDLPFEEWTEVFGSERLAGALLDRLTHDVHILEMNRDSYRLNQSRQKLPRLQTAEPSPLNALRGSKWSARTAAKNLSRRMLVSLLAPLPMRHGWLSGSPCGSESTSAPLQTVRMRGGLSQSFQGMIRRASSRS